MVKKELLKYLEKIPDHEELFLLRAQDESAPAVIMKWIDENLWTAPKTKIEQAVQTAYKMAHQEDVMRKKAD